MTTATAEATAGRLGRARVGSISRGRRRTLFWSYFFLILFVIFFLTPPVYMLITSLKTSAEISAATNPWWVFHPTLSNYIELLTQNQYLIFFRNSAIVSVCVVSVTMVVSILAAFALARMRFWGSAALATGVFLTYLIPESLLFIPLFKTFAFIHDATGIELINHWWVLIILYPTLTVPFATWLMIGYFSSIPKELDEAALIDGAGYLQMLTRIYIDNFRCFVNFEYRPARKQLILGGNGTGKSTLLEVLGVLREFAIHEKRAARLFTWRRKTRFSQPRSRLTFEVEA